MSQDLTQKQLEQMINPTGARAKAVFFEKPVLDREASVLAGMRKYVKAVYVKLIAPGVTDFIPYRAQQADFKKYPNEYEFFLSNMQGDRDPGVDIIPNLDIAHLQELTDMGLTTIPKLAAAEVPPHLESARLAAVAINAVLQEQNHGKEESKQEIKQESSPQVFTQSGRNDPDRIGRPELSAGNGSEDGQVAERVHSGGRINSGKGIDYSDFNFHIG